MVVKLTYFKLTGKLYSGGDYTTTLKANDGIWRIWNEVREMLETGGLPDLYEDHGSFIVLVDVPEHPQNGPHLIMDEHTLTHMDMAGA